MTFETQTLEEILRQPTLWQNYLESRTPQKLKDFLRNQDEQWCYIGCGTSYYLAQAAAFSHRQLTGRSAFATPASEVLIHPYETLKAQKTKLCLPISRSGKTTETILAAQKARHDFELPVVAISCDSQSPLGQEALMCTDFAFEKELSVVMTGSFTTMLLSSIDMSHSLSQNQPLQYKLPELGEKLDLQIKQNRNFIKDLITDQAYKAFVFLGQGANYAISCEAALKMQEMAINSSIAYHSLEYRHGPMSTADIGTLITLIISPDSKEYDKQLIIDLQKLGADVLAIHANDAATAAPARYHLNIGSQDPITTPLLAMPMLQLLAYYEARRKNINPDQPQNLSPVIVLNH